MHINRLVKPFAKSYKSLNQVELIDYQKHNKMKIFQKILLIASYFLIYFYDSMTIVNYLNNPNLIFFYNI